MASLRRNQRIFHNQTVVQIVSEVLADHADAGAFEVALSQDYQMLDYTVQFRENDMAFLDWMLECHGIAYHFQHVAGAQRLVLSDMVESHPTLGPRPCHPDAGHHQEAVEHFWHWRPARRVGTGAMRLTDCNFKKPNPAMAADATGDATHAHGKIESFDWPGEYLDPDGRPATSRRGFLGPCSGQLCAALSRNRGFDQAPLCPDHQRSDHRPVRPRARNCVMNLPAHGSASFVPLNSQTPRA